MNRHLPLALSMLLLCLTGTPATAQERQVPVDEEEKVDRIDAALEAKLSLFPGTESFHEVRLYMLPDSTYALEIFYNPSGERLKRRTILTAAEAVEFRRRVSSAIAAKLPEITLDQEGRTFFITGTTLLSLGYYGWALPLALDVDDDKTAVALYMLTSSAGFFVPYFATSSSRVTAGAATLSIGGGALGIAHGNLLAVLLDDSPETTTFFGLGALMSMTELVSGFYIADGSNMSAGKADVILVGGLFGTGFGMGSSEIAGLFDNGKEQTGAAISLAGAGLGYLGGNALANMQSYTTGDAQVLLGAGLLGGYIPLAIVDLLEVDDPEPYIAASMGGSALGLTAGHFLVKGHDFTASEGSFIVLSEAAGGLLGLGVAYLVSSNGDNNRDDNSMLYLTSSALGGLGGFGFMYGILSKKDAAREKDTGSLWRFRIAPEGVAAAALGDKLYLPDRVSIPIASVQARF